MERTETNNNKQHIICYYIFEGHEIIIKKNNIIKGEERYNRETLVQHRKWQE